MFRPCEGVTISPIQQIETATQNNIYQWDPVQFTYVEHAYIHMWIAI
jgi:hypothetical protein